LILSACLAAPAGAAAPKDASEWLRPNAVPEPANNATTPLRVELGRNLFFDPRLSGSNWISCANCHNPALGWSDGLPTAVGNNMKILGRATPSLINTAYNKIQMWDGRFRTLEEQALGPIAAEGEMDQNLDEVVAELGAIPGYVSMFEAAYPGEGITKTTLAKAIAAYERTIVSSDAPFDRWLKGDERAVEASAKRGFEIFKSKGRCDLCHGGFNFTDDSFHNIGLRGSTDPGRYAKVPIRASKGAFKTPTLRNIALTAPYMHDGRYATLEEVVDHYDRGGDNVENLDEQMQKLSLTAQDKKDLVSFMHALTSPPQLVAIPQLPNRIKSMPRTALVEARKPVAAEPAAPAAATKRGDEPVSPSADQTNRAVASFEVVQNDKAFFKDGKRVVSMKVAAGETVQFRNVEKVLHNLYSISDAKTFDLGTMRRGDARKVTFDQRGEVEVQCAVHTEMLLVVDVR
jgi:cytochrome c peroxidase